MAITDNPVRLVIAGTLAGLLLVAGTALVAEARYSPSADEIERAERRARRRRKRRK